MEEVGGQRLDSEGSLTMWSLSILSSVFILPAPTTALHPCSVHSVGGGDSQRLEKGDRDGNRFAGPRRKGGEWEGGDDRESLYRFREVTQISGSF